MKRLFIVLTGFLLNYHTIAQDIYSKSFGKNTDPAIIFLHGGPGYNSANFEVTTAHRLSTEGFFVIVYDRRGEGRSPDYHAAYTFKESFDDLKDLYKNYGIKTAHLIGHSFGGLLGTLFTEKNPKMVESLILVGSPIKFSESFETIIRESRSIYEAKNDTSSLRYLGKLEKMDPSSLSYSSYCFMNAMRNGFYSPDETSEEAKVLYDLFKTDEILKKNAAKMGYKAPEGFHKNEAYTSMDISTNLKKLHSKDIKVYGLYGKNDGLFSANQVTALGEIIGKEHLKYFEHCSHNVFIDQQTVFIQTLKDWLHN